MFRASSIGEKSEFAEKDQLDNLDNLVFPIYSLTGVLDSWAIKSSVETIGFLGIHTNGNFIFPTFTD